MILSIVAIIMSLLALIFCCFILSFVMELHAPEDVKRKLEHSSDHL